MLTPCSHDRALQTQFAYRCFVVAEVLEYIHLDLVIG